MSEVQFFTITVAVFGALFTMLAAVIGWIGSRAITRMDAMGEKLGDKLDNMAGELHTRINGLDTRVTRVEAIQGLNGK